MIEALNHNPDALMESPKAIRAFVHACIEGSRTAVLCAEHNCGVPCRLTEEIDVKQALVIILEAIRLNKPACYQASVDGESINQLSFLLERRD